MSPASNLRTRSDFAQIFQKPAVVANGKAAESSEESSSEEESDEAPAATAAKSTPAAAAKSDASKATKAKIAEVAKADAESSSEDSSSDEEEVCLSMPCFDHYLFRMTEARCQSCTSCRCKGRVIKR